jgi:circadian clock protein KaiC
MSTKLRSGFAEGRIATGCPGIDDILGGGFPAHRLYLIEGSPGAGKTTLALQFLLEGVRRGEPVLYVTLSESMDELRSAAESHGWSLDSAVVRELMASGLSLKTDDQYTMFHPAEVELSETTQTVLSDVERIKPTRVVFDSLSELRLLAGSPLRYRRQILALKQFFGDRNCTVLLLDDMTGGQHDLHVQSIAHGILRLQQLSPEYGAERRRLSVLKLRGSYFRGGYHDFIIRRGGLEVFPRLVANEHRGPVAMERIGSGIAELDMLLGGGLERGTSTLIAGAAGTGKSSLATQFAVAAARRGQRAALYLFDESPQTLFSRSAALDMDLRGHIEEGLITVQQVDPAEFSPGQLMHSVRRAAEADGASLVMIDSLNGYLNAMPEERFLVVQLHELLMYLGQLGVATILISAHQGLIGGAMSAPVEVSYLADAVILMRYFEALGEVRQAISVLKKRGGQHERTIREFRMGNGRITIGPPLREYRGILTGVPLPAQAGP